jgi:SAM-dependent methyltransferase
MDDWFTEWFDADYAALYAHRNEQEAEVAVRTALAVAPELGLGPVLDLACGSGRHLASLRRQNPLAFGMDLSAPLLREAPAELRPWLLRGDMRRLPIKAASLAGVTLWFTPFGYFSDPDNRTLLGTITALLAPGGVLLLDFLNSVQLSTSLVEEDTFERRGLRVLSRRTIEGDRIVKRMTLTRLDSLATRDVVESVRLYTPEELRAMASGSGLENVAELGSYDGTGFRASDSPRWIGIFRRNFKS